MKKAIISKQKSDHKKTFKKAQKLKLKSLRRLIIWELEKENKIKNNISTN